MTPNSLKLILILLLLHCQLLFYSAQLVSKLGFVRPEDCKDRQFFDISHLRCHDCPATTVPSEDRMSCKCALGYKKVTNFGGLSLTCEDCNKDLPPGETQKAPTRDGWSCTQCFDAADQPIAPDPVTGHCPVCDKAGEFSYQRTPFGLVELKHKCRQCGLRTYANPFNGESCVPCNPSLEGEDCQCKLRTGSIQTGGVCFGSQSLSTENLPPDNVALYTYQFPRTGVSVNSEYANRNLRASVALCQAKNLTACQLLGNLCVLNDYVRTAPSACSYFEQLSSEGQILEWKQNMPWLYYYASEASVELSRETAIPVSFLFEPGQPNSRLNFIAAKYSLDGQFLGMEPIVGGTLQLCKTSLSIMDGAYVFGRKYKQTCEIPVQEFWDHYNNLEFFDLYLDYVTDDGQRELYAIPVLDQNFRDGNNYVNEGTGEDDRRRWRLSRRFYLVDNVAGKETGTQPDELAKVIRYPSYIAINVALQTSKNGHILPPYLVIKHDEIPFEQYNVEGETAKVSLTFEVNYSMESRRHDKDLEITMGTLCSVAVLLAALKAYSWARRAGKLFADVTTIIKFLLYGVGVIADVFFLVMVAMALWLTVAYKGQRVAFYMLLTREQEWSFVAYLITATVLKFIDLLHTNAELMLTRTFFIDWERSRGHVIPHEGEQGDARPTADLAQLNPTSPIVIWRTYLVANEWNELQSYRKTSVALQLIAMVFFLEWLNFKALALAEPGATLASPPEEYQDTRLTRFAIASGLYLLIGFVQWTVNVIVVERIFVDHFRNFMDLCSISNISLLALTHPQFGYYIHGRSVHGYADTDMAEMNQMLQRERDNLCGQRGLEPGTEEQCFIVSLPNSFRDKYENVMDPVNSPNMPATRLTSTDLTTATMENVIKVYWDMNRFLSSFIDHAYSNIDYVVKNRTFLESVLDMEFADTSQIGTFYRDFSEMEYSKAFLYGNEWVHLSFDCLIFCMTDLIWRNFILAAAVTFTVSTIIRKVAEVFYTNNLVKHSLVDERFLI